MNRSTSLNAIGVDIGGSSIKAGIVTSTGSILHQLSVPVSRTDAQTLIGDVLATIARLQHIASVDAIGIASTGVTDAEQGVVLQSTTIKDYDGTNWKDILVREYNLPVIVENDVKAAAWGEYKSVHLPANSTVSFIAVGTGIGCGLIVDGKIWHGTSFAAGEIGYITIDTNGPEYNGNVGCLEFYAAAPSIIRYVQEKVQCGYRGKLLELAHDNPHFIYLPLIREAEDMGDELAREAFKIAGEMLGVGIVNLVHLFNPNMVILGGGVVEASKTYLKAAISLAMRRILRSARIGLEITPAQLGNNAAIVGAGLLAIERGQALNL